MTKRVLIVVDDLYMKEPFDPSEVLERVVEVRGVELD